MFPRPDPSPRLPQPPGMAEVPLPLFHVTPVPTAIPRHSWTAPLQLDLPLPADPLIDPPDPQLLSRLGAAYALRNGLLPWRRRNGAILILTAHPQDFTRCAPFLTALYGPALRPLPCPRPLIEAALLAHAGPALVTAAETRAPAIASARSFDRTIVTLTGATLAAAITLWAVLSPFSLFLALFSLATLSLFAITLFKCTTAIAAAYAPDPDDEPVADADLPTISLLIALYGEESIAPRLIRRLSALDYPRDRLDALILVEDDDAPTRAALAAAALPHWMRVIAVPAGRIRTKPRALNFGLDFTRGDIVGVYDAEDAPDPQQLRTVAASFAAAPPHVACLQGALDFYNPTTNWIARCFTMDYAVWFRLLLPGMQRLGLPLPLGGTTLFLRRKALVAIGAWDAHNVTEDADLGLRLARNGWTTRILPCVTLEEANCRPIGWIRQRARWTKGYLMTWLVHMRAPRQLWRDLGPRGFAGAQILLLGTLMQVLFTPFYWLVFLLSLLGHDPLAGVLPTPALAALICLGLFSQFATLTITAIALRLAGHPPQWRWLPLLIPYFWMATFAAVKAMTDAAISPFHWDKTRHGQFDDTA